MSETIPEVSQTIPSSSNSDYKTLDLSLKNMGYSTAPHKFHGFDIATFGLTRKNPFFDIKAIAENLENSFSDRTEAIRYLQKIPHKDMHKNVLPICKSIIEDDRYPITDRYFFFSNNEPITKLDSYIVRDCTYHYFKISEFKPYPIVLRIYSAKYIYTTLRHIDPLWIESRNFIKSLALDSQESVYIRSEAADILYTHINKEDYEIGFAVINELGSLYADNKIRTIYNNSQNAHDKSITESVINIIRNLLSESRVLPKAIPKDNASIIGFANDTINTFTIYERLVKVVETINRKSIGQDGVLEDKPLYDIKIISAVYHSMIINPSKYEGLTLVDILYLVWNKIQAHEHRLELEQRLVQELSEMDQTCSSGYVSRLVNTLSGYISNNFEIKMNIEDQLKSNVFARIHNNLKMLSENEQDIIIEELAGNGAKPYTMEFLSTYSVKDELYDEFVKQGYISDELFLSTYEKCIKDFTGTN